MTEIERDRDRTGLHQQHTTVTHSTQTTTGGLMTDSRMVTVQVGRRPLRERSCMCRGAAVMARFALF